MADGGGCWAVQGHVRFASASEASDAELDDEGLARACDAESDVRPLD
jgi:hypothetical protein